MIHLRLHHEPRWSTATRARPGDEQGRRRYWAQRDVWHDTGNGMVRIKMVRIMGCACDQKMRRAEFSSRKADHLAGKRRVDCPACLIILDQLLEHGSINKPLTERRIRAFKKERFDL